MNVESVPSQDGQKARNGVRQRPFDASRLPAVREGFARRGETIRSWAIRNGFEPKTVYNVLTGKFDCPHGKMHAIAVALGLKDLAPADSTVPVQSLSPEPALAGSAPTVACDPSPVSQARS